MMSGTNLGIVYKNMAFDRLEDLQRRREEMINAALAGGHEWGVALGMADGVFGQRIIMAREKYEAARDQLAQWENRPRWWHKFMWNGKESI